MLYGKRTLLPLQIASTQTRPETGYAIASPMHHAHLPPGRNHPASDTKPPGMSLGGKVDNETIAACKICVESAIRSTTAFDKVRRRLIITNIFGTAHA